MKILLPHFGREDSASKQATSCTSILERSSYLLGPGVLSALLGLADFESITGIRFHFAILLFGLLFLPFLLLIFDYGVPDAT